MEEEEGKRREGTGGYLVYTHTHTHTHTLDVVVGGALCLSTFVGCSCIFVCRAGTYVREIDKLVHFCKGSCHF